MKHIGESARSADLTIRLVVKANSMSARTVNIRFVMSGVCRELGYIADIARTVKSVQVWYSTP